jgi:hypothetical protein
MVNGLPDTALIVGPGVEYTFPNFYFVIGLIALHPNPNTSV